MVVSDEREASAAVRLFLEFMRGLDDLDVTLEPTQGALTLAFAEYVGSANDESPLAEQLAAQLGTRHATVMVRKADFIEQRDQLPLRGQEPQLVERLVAEFQEFELDARGLEQRRVPAQIRLHPGERRGCEFVRMQS